MTSTYTTRRVEEQGVKPIRRRLGRMWKRRGGEKMRSFATEEKRSMKTKYAAMAKRGLQMAGVVAVLTSGTAFAQNKAIGFKDGMPFSEGYVAGKTLYVAGQQGPDENGKVTGTDIELQTTNTIAAVKKVVEEAGFKMTDIVSVTLFISSLDDVPKMNEVYKKLMPDPKPARATVQVAGLIGGAKIEMSAIAVKK
jgi:2-iminobutanoate/2-iminopropanoate deaminase